MEAWLSRFDRNTADAYRRDIDQFATWLDRDPLTATRPEVQAWIGHLRDTGLAPSTIRRKASSASSYLNYAAEEGTIDTNPAAHVRRPRGAGDVELGLTAEQTRLLLDAARDISTTAHALVLLLVTTGLRISEAVGADLGDITTDSDHVVLRVKRKGGNIDLVPLAPSVHVVLTADGRDVGPLFLSNRGRRLDRQAAGRLISTAGKRAGLVHVHPHQLRHTAATQAIEAGEPLEAVQALLGHASPATTQKYLRAINRLDGSARTANTLARTFGTQDHKEDPR